MMPITQRIFKLINTQIYIRKKKLQSAKKCTSDFFEFLYFEKFVILKMQFCSSAICFINIFAFPLYLGEYYEKLLLYYLKNKKNKNIYIHPMIFYCDYRFFSV